MKKLFTLLALGSLLVGCSAESETTPERTKFFIVNEEATIEINTNYTSFNETIYDLNGTEPVLVYESSKDLKIDYKFNKVGRYKFEFRPTTPKEIPNPYTVITIKNKTTNKVIDVSITDTCLIGYGFKFQIHKN